MTTTRSSSSSVPLGPFTGYASILMRSRFLKPAQQSLDDFCSGGFYSCEAIILSDFLHHHHHHHHYHIPSSGWISRILNTSRAWLRHVVWTVDIRKTVQNIDVSELVFAHISYPNRFRKSKCWPDRPVFRGLRFVTILNVSSLKFTFIEITCVCGQVSNWFINARVRLWKPMVEETHKLEKQQSQTPSEAANLDVNMPTSADHQLVTTESGKPEIVPTKRPKHKSIVSIASNQSHEEPNIQNSSLRNLSSSQHIGVTGSSSAGGSCVSLALGLHRNIIRNELSKPGTINIACNLDMETGPEAQNPEKDLGRAGN
ncbi:hypothetical protein JRO89_XS14G0076600 [Xanthoceras sorbifolium]|uniref:Uncharacterized protein n=1 Tax=Xanthoceras sorbifolium TaxID=99658 RepID=A0ABQ8H4D4_9ROSI|nr:hypothetical protein JRO89_XS14G0076600 [Xanthoceras sorbifolium]